MVSLRPFGGTMPEQAATSIVIQVYVTQKQGVNDCVDTSTENALLRDVLAVNAGVALTVRAQSYSAVRNYRTLLLQQAHAKRVVIVRSEMAVSGQGRRPVPSGLGLRSYQLLHLFIILMLLLLSPIRHLAD